jgi:hypothetical protein
LDRQSLTHLSTEKKMRTTISSTRDHPLDPELVCTDIVLPATLEEEIKEGFFELK